MKKTVILFVLFSLVFTLPARADMNSDLLRAVKGWYIATVQLLLDRGADVNVKDKKGITVLMWAALHCRTDIVKSLLAKGSNVNAKDKKGRTALMAAAHFGDTEIVKLLLDHGADVNVKDKKGETALKRAKKAGKTKIIELLKQHGAKDEIKEIGRDGNFIAYDNKVVYDESTGLEWIAGPDKDTHWDKAKAWTESLAVNGGGWRMPTSKELKSLFRKGKGTRNMTPLLKTTGWWVWSRARKHSSTAWFFNFGYGGVDNWYDRKGSGNSRGFAVRSRKKTK